MNKFLKVFNLLRKNKGQLMALGLYQLSSLFPDKIYLSLLYRFKMGCWIDWKNPKTFTEKLQWLKLYNRKSEYTTMVDKFAVKQYVANLIGEEYIIPTLGVWDNANDINWDLLPKRFVLKTTHGGGGEGVVICKNKATFDKKKAISKLNKSLSKCLYKLFREWPYKNVPKRIIAEKYMEETLINNENGDLLDYKFYCFNGIPQMMLMATGRHMGKLCFDYYDMEWNKLPLEWDRPNSNINHSRPTCFEEMKKMATILSKGIPHVRCDFYVIDNKPYFGELTFFDSSGYSHFKDETWNYKLGAMIRVK